MAEFYKLVAKGNSYGSLTQNTFYYRAAVGLEADLWPMAGAEGLAKNFKQEVWDGAWKDTVSTYFTLTELAVYPMNSAFELIYTLPYVLGVNETGSVSGEFMGAGTCVNIRFNLQAQTTAQNMLAPKRGYVAISGVSESQQNLGYLNMGFWDNDLSDYGKLAKKFAATLQELTPPASWIPIRAKQIKTPVLGGPLFTAYSDVEDASVRRVLSFRRSRKPA